MSHSRAIGHAVTLINTLCLSGRTNIYCGNYTTARAELTEGIALSGEKSAMFWKAQATASLGVVSALIDEAIDAVNMIGAGIAMWRSTGATASVPFFQSYLAKAHAMLGQFDEAQRHIDQAMATIESTGERVWPLRYSVLAGKSLCCHRARMQLKRRPISSVRSHPHANNKRNPGNSAPR